MNIPGDPEQQKCSGVIDAARVQEELIGKTVMEVMKKSALKVLQSLVVDEERIIEKGPLTIYSKMYVEYTTCSASLAIEITSLYLIGFLDQS